MTKRTDVYDGRLGDVTAAVKRLVVLVETVPS
jgi:hypothetical protein